MAARKVDLQPYRANEMYNEVRWLLQSGRISRAASGRILRYMNDLIDITFHYDLPIDLSDQQQSGSTQQGDTAEPQPFRVGEDLGESESWRLLKKQM